MNTIPEVGSKWLLFGVRAEEVVSVKKRGRGYQVASVGTHEDTIPDEQPTTWRLRDFLKNAKKLPEAL